jgi:nucleoside-diphosphate-sugar epimerase
MEEHNSVLTPAIEKGSLVLITGVSGYIGGHIANQFLRDGYRVRGTFRTLDKVRWMQEHFDKHYGRGRFEAVEVRDMTADGAFDEAVKGASGICHVASVTTVSDKPDEVIPPTVGYIVETETCEY